MSGSDPAFPKQTGCENCNYLDGLTKREYGDARIDGFQAKRQQSVRGCQISHYDC